MVTIEISQVSGISQLRAQMPIHRRMDEQGGIARDREGVLYSNEKEQAADTRNPCTNPQTPCDSEMLEQKTARCVIPSM